MTKRFLASVFTVCAVALIAIGQARAADEFKQLKTQNISLSSGRALIVLPDGGEPLRSLRFRVKDGALPLTSVVIVYADLGEQTIDVTRDAIPDGGSYTVHTERRDQSVRQLMMTFVPSNRTIQLTLLGRAPIAPKSPAVAQEKLAWNAIRERNKREDYEKYLDDYPEGLFRLPARRALDQPKRADAEAQRKLTRQADRQSRTRSVARNPAEPSNNRGLVGRSPSRPTSPPIADARRTDPPAVPSEIPCVAAMECTPVSVFFGTNRERDDKPDRINFGWQDANRLQFGRAVVTVPRHGNRPIGSIARPTYWDLYVRRIPPEGDPKRHFVIAKDGIAIFSTEQGFVDAIQKHRDGLKRFKDDAFVFVHGYNTDFDEALYRTAQIAFDLGAPELLNAALGSGGGSSEPHLPYGTAFMYTWPSAGSEKDYGWDKDYIRLSIDHLERFLKVVIEKSGAKNVHLIAHSMGNIGLLNALGEYVEKADGNGASARINQVILAAPDISESEFIRLARKILPAADGMTLYASSRDWALSLSRRFHRGQPRVGEIIEGSPPIVIKGVDSIDISQITNCYFCSGHNEFADQKELLGDIGRLLRNGIRPPDRRAPGTIEPQVASAGMFWRYLKQ